MLVDIVRPGRSVCKLDGSVSSKFATNRSRLPAIPFTQMPAGTFTHTWPVPQAGRWHHNDHITLGEARGHVKICQALAGDARCHNPRILALNDNAPTSCSMNKVRSPSFALNYLCRRRAASNLAANIICVTPWCETNLMPVDDASRDRAQIPAPISAATTQCGNKQFYRKCIREFLSFTIWWAHTSIAQSAPIVHG